MWKSFSYRNSIVWFLCLAMCRIELAIRILVKHQFFWYNCFSLILRNLNMVKWCYYWGATDILLQSTSILDNAPRVQWLLDHCTIKLYCFRHFTYNLNKSFVIFNVGSDRSYCKSILACSVYTLVRCFL